MSEFQASNFKKENGGTPDLLGKTELTSPYFFVPPSGTTAERPESCAAGTLRFNTDIGTLEVYKGDTIGWWAIQRRESQYLGGGTGSNAGTGTRGITAGGNTPSFKEEIEYVTISTFGNTQDFGNLTAASTGNAGSASSTRGLFTCQGNPATNVISFITISSTGDAADFGDATINQGYRNSLASSTRSVTGSHNSSGNIIDYVTIASTGNSQDFGDLTYSISMPFAFASTTRGIFAGGNSSDVINFITIASTGNATVFGSLSAGTVACNGAVSNATRGCMKFRTGSYINTIEFLTTATLGNSVDFGDSTNNAGGNGGLASPTRGLFAGGYGTPHGFTTQLAAIEIPTTGNAVDFGDMSYAADAIAGLSNGHGGL